MISFKMSLEHVTPLDRKQIEYLVKAAGSFSSHIMYTHRSRTINGKSMLGLLSLGATGSSPVEITVEGEDEQKAAEALRRILEEGVISPKSYEDAEELLYRIKEAYLDILGEKLAALYVHGSMAFGCFNWSKSDIDLLVIVRSDPGPEKLRKLVQTLADMEQDAPAKGLEMSVMLESDCNPVGYPTPFIMHYSPMHAAAFREDPEKYCEKMRGADPDLICHIAALKRADITLLGPEPKRMFGPVNRNDVLDSILLDSPDSPEELHRDPVYVVLNLCRALAYRRENVMLSKLQGGEWGLDNLDQDYQGIIQAAMNAYMSDNDMSYDSEKAEDFMYDCLEELREPDPA
ncbi:MAG: DNA polymerase subunit beta [Clostridiales bacterium]|nr:DNA polymerase subunit beta [Clostridiales bacterium]